MSEQVSLLASCTLELESDLRRVTVETDLRGAAHSFEHLQYVCVCVCVCV